MYAQNEISKKYNELHSAMDLMKSENAHLTKSLKEVETTISVRVAELKRVEWHADYYEDKSSSIKMYTTVKVRAEIMKKFAKGKTSSWNPEAAFKSSEKMKTLYSESEEEDELQSVAFVGNNEPSGAELGERRSVWI